MSTTMQTTRIVYHLRYNQLHLKENNVACIRIILAAVRLKIPCLIEKTKLNKFTQQYSAMIEQKQDRY